MLETWLLLLISFCLLFLLLRTKRPKNFPPGPCPIPIFGSLLKLNLTNPIKDLEKLSERYGKVYSLYIMGKPAVVLNGLQANKEAMVTQSIQLAGRPQDVLFTHISQNKGIIFVDYGRTWKDNRRFALSTLRNFGLGKQSMEEKILEEISHVMLRLESSAGSSMDPQYLFHLAAANIICSVIFGSRSQYEDQHFKDLIKLMSEIGKIVNGQWAMLYDTLPIVRRLPLPFKRAFRIYDRMHKHVLDIVIQHKKTWVLGKPRDLTDCYLDELHKKGENDKIEEGQIVPVLRDLLLAATDTTSNTIRSALLYLMTHPDIQERCQEEIDIVLEGKPHASYEDRHQMPYVQAMIHEVQRVSNMAPLSIFHSAIRDTQLMGYDIPKGTMIIQNLTSVLFEESQWKFPHEFNPSNFLDEQGQFVKPEAFIPFSIGPRICLGESLARMELFLTLVTLLRQFNFLWPEDAGEPDFTPAFGGIQSPKPYQLGVRLRGNTGSSNEEYNNQMLLS